MAFLIQSWRQATDPDRHFESRATDFEPIAIGSDQSIHIS